jgi:hypothetical protein
MTRLWQVLANVALYGVLIYYAVDATWLEPDPWFAFVVWFLLFVSAVVSVIPSLRAKGLSPGEYPYED